MKRHLLMGGLIVASLATLTYAAVPESAPLTPFDGGKWANSPLGKMISGNLGRLLTLRSELDVTADQRAQIHEVLKSHRSEIVATVKLLYDARTDLRDVVMTDEADESEIRSAADALGNAIADAAVKRAKLRKEIAPLLTPEQQELVREFMAENDAAVDKFLANAATAP
jgi:Spy/CpxP family protein refolding chaperone